MCSVAGYVGSSKDSKQHILESLSRLEYRGYDSAGFACIENKNLYFAKSIGKLENLVQKIQNQYLGASMAIGHTRWSTHGLSTEQNAHPQIDCSSNIAVVHNGIIENFSQIKKNLISQGHLFKSETDTEVIAHLLEHNLNLLSGNYKDFILSVASILKQLEGAYAFVAIIKDFDGLILAKHSSPLCIGLGENENFIASDPLAFSGKCNKVVFLPDNTFAIVKKDDVKIFDLDCKEVVLEVVDLPKSLWVAATTLNHESFMLKEIYEQKDSIFKSISYYKSLGDQVFDKLGLADSFIGDLNKIVFVACGTSWHAGRIARFFFEEICNISVAVPLASEFRYSKFFPSNKSLYFGISQSGETADTIEALKMIRSYDLQTAVVTNVDNSTLVRETDGSLIMQAGPEIAVASTKAFSCQVASLFWLANKLALKKNLISQEQMEKAEQDLYAATVIMEDLLDVYKQKIETLLALKYSVFHRFIFLGRNISYPFALEAALKLKEISYLFVNAYPAGELKHGPIALIDIHTPVFIFSHQDPLIYKKLVSNAQEVKARGGRIVAFAFEGQEELIGLSEDYFVIPRVNPLLGPLAMTGLVQFFVYNIAKMLGRSIDKPRNLAKSVTVE